ncbi:hypothetical protein G7Y89_g1199 [Cudoniella acicularis]|uniref:Cytochrome P450 n=1 Tax=Cudoniella acicularis TaxID=354080 RepID=A0A8H4RVQ4_9HELO|nr:hypothetical protein G7Y89_g1199 [Cudoniella acicularis]
METTRKSRFAVGKLPVEAIQAILSSASSIPSLISLALSCTSFYRALLGAQALITLNVLENEVGEGALQQAILAMRASKMKKHKPRDIRYFVRKNITFPEQYKTNTQISILDALFISKLDQHVTYFAHDFVSKALAYMPSQTLSAEDLKPPSRTEINRIKGALYFFELYCNLFRTPDTSPDLQREIFFSKFCAWENEQLATIREYLLRIITPAFDDVAAHDVIWGSMQVKFARHDTGTWMGFTEPILARGLAYLHRVALANTYEERYAALEPRYPRQSQQHLLVSLMQSNAWETCRYPQVRNKMYDGIHLEHFSKEMEDILLRLPLSKDPDTGPREAWYWAHQRQVFSEFVASKLFRKEREWGYVLWDFTRLEKAGIFQKEWEETEMEQPAPDNTWRESCLKRFRIGRAGGTGWWSADDERLLGPQQLLIAEKFACERLPGIAQAQAFIELPPEKDGWPRHGEHGIKSALDYKFQINTVVHVPEQPRFEELRPLDLREYQPSAFTPRALSNSTVFSPRDAEQLLWGSQSNYTYASLILETPTSEKILYLDRFIPLLSNVTCGAQTILTFKDAASFSAASKAWQWVNANATQNFIFIGDDPSCGESATRNIYYINNMASFPQNLTTYLYGTESSLSTLNNTMTITHGTAILPSKRSIGDIDFTPSVTIPVGTIINLFNGIWDLADATSVESAELNCNPCGVAGSLVISSRFVINLSKLKEASLTLTPQDLSIGLVGQLNMHGAMPPLPISWSQTKQFGIPDLGFTIKDVATLGLIATAGYGATVKSLSGTTNVTFGAALAIPSDASFRLDLLAKDVVSHTSWEPITTEQPFSLSMVRDMDVSVFTNVGLGLTASIFGRGAEAGLQLTTPSVDFNTVAEVNGKDVPCGGKDGVQISGTIGTTLSFEMEMNGAFSGCVPIKRDLSAAGGREEKRDVGGGVCKTLAEKDSQLFSKKVRQIVGFGDARRLRNLGPPLLKTTHPLCIQTFYHFILSTLFEQNLQALDRETPYKDDDSERYPPPMADSPPFNDAIPLRHLPGPKGGMPLLRYGTAAFERPAGQAFLKWMTTIPNDGLLQIPGFFNSRAILPTNPETLAEILVHKNYDWEKPSELISFLRLVLGDGLILTEGEEHKFQRKHISPAFSFRHIRELIPVFWGKSVELRDGVECEMRENEGGVVEVNHWANKGTLDIIGVAGLGRDFRALAHADDPLVKNYEEILEPTKEKLVFFVCNILFGRRLVSILPWKLNDRLKETTVDLRRFCYQLVREKKDLIEKHGEEQLDILSLLIKSNCFSDDVMVDQLLTFIAAGHETTSSTFTWATYLLAKHPEIQTRLRDEIRSQLPSPSSPDPEIDIATVLESLPYLHAVCYETIRLYPAVPVTIRIAVRDTNIAGTPIPKGTRLQLAPWAINRSPEIWGEDAEELKPERWIDEDGHANNTGGVLSNYSNLTFLHGARSCIGEKFAKSELKALVAVFCGSFEMEMADLSEVAEPAGVITTKPKNGMRLRLKRVDGW